MSSSPGADPPPNDPESRPPSRSGNSRRLALASPACSCLAAISKPGVPLVKKVIAEFVGTFILTFSAAATPIVNQKYDGAATLLGAAASAGLAVTVIIISIGHISGAHLNPAVTIAFAAVRHFPLPHVAAYVLAQASGSVAASLALKGIFHPFHSGGVTVPAISAAPAFFLEFVITFTLMFVIVAVATDARAVKELAGVAIGATVLLNILVAGPSTGGSMNPARTLGPAIATGNYEEIWIYMAAPVTGAIAGAYSYKAVKLEAMDMGEAHHHSCTAATRTDADTP